MMMMSRRRDSLQFIDAKGRIILKQIFIETGYEYVRFQLLTVASMNMSCLPCGMLRHVV
jgi:hypothetical protein